MTIQNPPWEALFNAAEEARRCAHAPYSHFAVGAAVWTSSDTILKGCNVENASYGLSVCAERNAIGQMVLQGLRPQAAAIVVDSKTPTPPCGMCRQVLAEFASPDMVIRSRTLQGQESQWTLEGLLPFAFTRSFL